MTSPIQKTNSSLQNTSISETASPEKSVASSKYQYPCSTTTLSPSIQNQLSSPASLVRTLSDSSQKPRELSSPSLSLAATTRGPTPTSHSATPEHLSRYASPSDISRSTSPAEHPRPGVSYSHNLCHPEPKIGTSLLYPIQLPSTTSLLNNPSSTSPISLHAASAFKLNLLDFYHLPNEAKLKDLAMGSSEVLQVRNLIEQKVMLRDFVKPELGPSLSGMIKKWSYADEKDHSNGPTFILEFDSKEVMETALKHLKTVSFIKCTCFGVPNSIHINSTAESSKEKLTSILGSIFGRGVFQELVEDDEVNLQHRFPQIFGEPIRLSKFENDHLDKLYEIFNRALAEKSQVSLDKCTGKMPIKA